MHQQSYEISEEITQKLRLKTMLIIRKLPILTVETLQKNTLLIL